MSDADQILLPLARHGGGHAPDQEQPACSPTAYVSNEEAAIAKAMLRLRAEAEKIKAQLATAISDSDRPKLNERLIELRRERELLGHRRNEAARRKMIMLGHLPPDGDF